MKYFSLVTTLEELKKEYRKLCFELHPDRNHDRDTTQEFQQMQNEYEKKFDEVKNVFRNSKGETYTKENNEVPEEFEEIINSIIYMDGVEIDIIGSWLWLSGNTKVYKDQIKELNFKWASNKCAWYYHTGTYKKRSKKKFNLDELKEMFESSKVNNKTRLALD